MGSAAESETREQAAARVGDTGLVTAAELAEEWGRTAVVEEGSVERLARLYHMLTDMRVRTEGSEPTGCLYKWAGVDTG